MMMWLRKNFKILPLYISLLGIVLWFSLFFVGEWSELWISKDQQGYQLYKEHKYKQAAENFDSLSYKGAALFKIGEFKKAKAIYILQTSKEAKYNLGNCEMMLGDYDKAIKAYNTALKIDPQFTQAKENRELALIRKKLKEVENDGKQGIGDHEDMGADEVKYDNTENKGVDDKRTAKKEMESGNPNWLDRIETTPKSFLKNKFSYQYQMKGMQNVE